MKIRRAVFFLCFYFSFNAHAYAKPVSVDVAYSGNDGLTKSLEKELRSQISHSREFTIRKDNRSLKLVIVENVQLKRIANHNQASYKVNFISQEKIIGVSVGSCWQEQIHECAYQILNDVKITIRQNP